jgi:hypothetical protein
MPVHQTIGYHRHHQHKTGVSHEPAKARANGHDVDRPLTNEEAKAMIAACNVWLRKRGIPVLDFSGWQSHFGTLNTRLKVARKTHKRRCDKRYQTENAYWLRPLATSQQRVRRTIAKVARAISAIDHPQSTIRPV